MQERQELARVFGEVAYEEIGKLAIHNHWAEGSPEKVALHALVGGIMAQMGGSSFASGAVGAGVNEAIQGELAKIKDPALHQWASAIVGAAAAKAVGGNAQTGAATAASGTKNNFLNTRDKEELIKALISALENKADKNQLLSIIDTYLGVDENNRSQAPDMPGSIYSEGWDQQLHDLLYVIFGYTWDQGIVDSKNLANLQQHLNNLPQVPSNVDSNRLNELYAKNPEAFKSFLKSYGKGVLVTVVVVGGTEVVLSGATLGELIAAGEITLVSTGGRLHVQIQQLSERGRQWLGISQGTGTVWDTIKATAGNMPGTAIPATFQIQNGQRILWVNSNATEHMGEYINRFGAESWTIQMRSQALLSSFNSAAQEAMVKIGTSPAGRHFINVGGWELGINTETGVIYHALYR